MTTNERDPVLQQLFIDAKQDLEDESITAGVMARTQRLKVRLLGGAVLGGLLILLISWLAFAGPLLEFALLVSGFLATPLVELGEGWLALAIMPINTVASVVALAGKAAWSLYRRLLNYSFSG